MQSYPIIQDSAFQNSENLFEDLKQNLSENKVLSMNHSELEELLRERGREILCSLFQDSLNLRSSMERSSGILQSVVGANGIARTHHRVGHQRIETIFGTVELERIAYAMPGMESLCPLDASLNLPKEQFSFGLRKRIAIEASKGSFDEAIEAVALATGTTVPKRQAEELARLAATDFDSFYRISANRGIPTEGTGELLIMTADGKGIVMRNEDLREGTKKAAATSKRKLSKRISRGEKRNRKRMATVAAVYTISRFYRTPEEIVSDLKKNSEAKKEYSARRPSPEHKRVWAKIREEPRQVFGEVFREAKLRDPEYKKRWVALVDGNKTQLKLLKSFARSNGIILTIVLDSIHVKEYLWRAVPAFHEEGTLAAEKWVLDRFLEVLKGNAGLVAGGIRRSATKRGVEGKNRERVDKCAEYLLKYKEFLKYDEYLRDGLPIATGVIEGACRHLVKDRMDVTGARWSLDGAGAVLCLRALRSSGDFEKYWEYHQEREYVRNHSSRYEDGVPSIPALSQRPKLRVIK